MNFILMTLLASCSHNLQLLVAGWHAHDEGGGAAVPRHVQRSAAAR